MADVKWIKIATDIFDDEKILLIESLPDKYAIITCWFKLLCLAGKQNNSGVFMLNDKIAYTDEMLSTIFRMHVNTVRLSLQTFKDFGMIELIEGVITIPNWEKHQQLDAFERNKEYHKKYMRNVRAKQKQIASSINCDVNSEVNGDVTVNALDIDIDKEEDIDNNITIINNTNICPLVSEKPDEHAVISLILKSKKVFNVYTNDIEHYRELYPAVDVIQELKLMCGWLESNPANRKTETGIKAFITRWLSKKQDKAPRVVSTTYTPNYNGGNGGFESL